MSQAEKQRRNWHGLFALVYIDGGHCQRGLLSYRRPTSGPRFSISDHRRRFVRSRQAVASLPAAQLQDHGVADFEMDVFMQRINVPFYGALAETGEAASVTTFSIGFIDFK